MYVWVDVHLVTLIFSQQRCFLRGDTINWRVTQLTQPSALISFFDPCALWLSVYFFCMVDVGVSFLCLCMRVYTSFDCKRDDLRDAHERALAYVQIVNYNYTLFYASLLTVRTPHYHVTLRRADSNINKATASNLQCVNFRLISIVSYSSTNCQLVHTLRIDYCVNHYPSKNLFVNQCWRNNKIDSIEIFF